jgi:hypothetical protein
MDCEKMYRGGGRLKQVAEIGKYSLPQVESTAVSLLLVQI